MATSRRRFLSHSATGVLGLPLAAHGTRSQQAPAPPASAPAALLDPAALSFWTRTYGRPPAAPRLGAMPAGDERAARFFVHTPAAGFRLPTSPPIDANELATGTDMRLTLQVLSFKPSADDSRQFDTHQSGTMRVDIAQSQAETTAAEPKSWTAVAGLATANNAKLSPQSVNTLDVGTPWGDPHPVTLPQGGGLLSLQFFLQRQDALWHQVLTGALQGVALGSHMVPLLSLAAATRKEWTSFNSVLGTLLPAPNATKSTHQATYLLSPTTVVTAASRSAFAGGYADGLPLINGTYIVVPQAHYENFGNLMTGMDLVQNYVVPHGTAGQSVFRVAYDHPGLQKVSYLCLRCQVAPAPSPTGNCGKATAN